MLTLNIPALSTFLLSHDLPSVGKDISQRAIALKKTTPELLDTFRRLVCG